MPGNRGSGTGSRCVSADRLKSALICSLARASHCRSEVAISACHRAGQTVEHGRAAPYSALTRLAISAFTTIFDIELGFAAADSEAAVEYRIMIVSKGPT